MKKIIKVFLCCVLSAVTVFSANVSVAAYSTDDIVRAALELIYNHEGTYTSILANDNGAVSLGKIGWHATRALNLLQTIVNKNKTQASSILGSTLYNEILSASSWNTRKFTSSESTVVSKLLGTEEGKSAQDELAFNDVKTYIVHGQSYGFTDGKILVFFADMENQCGSYVSDRVAKAVKASAGSAEKVTLTGMYNASLADKTAGSSPSRRKSAYTYCYGLKFDSSAETIVYLTGTYTIATTDGYSPLRVRSGPGTSYAQLGSIPYGTTVTVTEVSGDWGKISYNGNTGWISLLYAKHSGTSVSPSGKGDVDGNGSVDASDARTALRAAASLTTLTEAQRTAADVDGDGKVSSSDARTILRVAAQLQTF